VLSGGEAFVSSAEYERAQPIFRAGSEKYGAAAVERIRYAFALGAGLAPAVTAPSPDQRPHFFFPGLTARPFHEPADFAFGAEVEAATSVIRTELERAACTMNGFQPYRQDEFVPEGRWDALYFRIGNIWLEENRSLCPETVHVLEAVPRLSEVAMFSALSAGGHIAPHCGAWNCRITLHLGLVIPEQCTLRVGKETRRWEQGKLLVFDDTFEHEAWNRSGKDRYVLLFDVWHPDLSDVEVELLEQLREEAGIRRGKPTVEQIRKDRLRYPQQNQSSAREVIDWSRLAEPQADEYDTEAILQFASRAGYRRTSAGSSPSVFDGQVAVRYVYHALPEFGQLSKQFPDAPEDHRNIALAAEYIRRWPAAFRQCQRLLEAIHPALHPQISLESGDIYRGSVCHSDGRLFGTLWATIFCPLGLAEAIVQEMAHQKLRALGVTFEYAASGSEVDVAGILRTGYACVHATTLDTCILQKESDPTRRKALEDVLERNLARLEEGPRIVRHLVKSGGPEQGFIEGFFAWIEKSIEAGRAILGHRSAPFVRDHSGEATLAHLLRARRPVVFAYNGGIGDRLCNLPALRALSALFGDRLGLICGQGDRELYYSDLKLRATYEPALGLASTGFTFDARVLAKHIGECDLILSINPWHTDNVSELLGLFPQAESIGFFPNFRHSLPCDYEANAVDMAFAVPAALYSGLRVADYSQPPAISEKALEAARAFRRRAPRWSRTLFLHTDTKPEKMWRAERFDRVIDRFLQDFPDFGILTVDVRGSSVRENRYQGRMVPLTLPLDVCFALLSKCDLFLGIDSCHIHAADLFRVPGVGLFGPTTSRRWGYRFTDHLHVQGLGSMDSIGVEEVGEALSTFARRLYMSPSTTHFTTSGNPNAITVPPAASAMYCFPSKL
jgi:aspartyl/asparaginyl beta-hydroxylase (cupin superfamily)